MFLKVCPGAKWEPVDTPLVYKAVDSSWSLIVFHSSCALKPIHHYPPKIKHQNHQLITINQIHPTSPQSPWVSGLVSLALRASSFILLLTALPRSLQSIQRCRCRRGASRRNCGGLQLRGAGSAGLWQQTRLRCGSSGGEMGWNSPETKDMERIDRNVNVHQEIMWNAQENCQNNICRDSELSVCFWSHLISKNLCMGYHPPKLVGVPCCFPKSAAQMQQVHCIQP